MIQVKEGTEGCVTHKALSVKQPYASLLVEPAYRQEGQEYARKSIEVRSQNIHYRGDVVICSTSRPALEGLMTSCCLGIVELYGVKPLSEFTDDDWRHTCIEPAKRPKEGYGWLMRNPRRVIEFPVKGQLGLWNLHHIGELIEYPRIVRLDDRAWENIKPK